MAKRSLWLVFALLFGVACSAQAAEMNFGKKKQDKKSSDSSLSSTAKKKAQARLKEEAKKEREAEKEDRQETKEQLEDIMAERARLAGGGGGSAPDTEAILLSRVNPNNQNIPNPNTLRTVGVATAVNPNAAVAVNPNRILAGGAAPIQNPSLNPNQTSPYAATFAPQSLPRPNPNSTIAIPRNPNPRRE